MRPAKRIFRRRDACMPGALTALTLAVSLGGCATGPDSWVVTSPGKFAFYSCDQIAARGRTTTVRLEELKHAMAKASQGPGGGIVTALAYQSEYAVAEADLRELDVTAAGKKCENTWHPVSARVIR